MVREVASKTSTVAGDGTTTATILAHAMDKGTTGSRNTPSTGGRGPGIHAPDTRWMVAAAEEYRQGWCRPKD
jgi:hypothetical protein